MRRYLRIRRELVPVTKRKERGVREALGRKGVANAKIRWSADGKIGIVRAPSKGSMPRGCVGPGWELIDAEEARKTVNAPDFMPEEPAMGKG